MSYTAHISCYTQPTDPNPQLRRNAVDYHAWGLPKDHFHENLPKQVVGQCPERCWALYFHTQEIKTKAEAVLGVALSQCEYGGEGVEMRQTPVPSIMPPVLLAQFSNSQAPIRITWPGYQHLNYQDTVFLRTTTGNLAQQIAKIFRTFYDQHHKDYFGHGIRLGPNYITYDRLRLNKIYWRDDAWYIELSYVYDREPSWDRF